MIDTNRREELAACARDIARLIARDIANTPNFSLTRMQLAARIDNYCDDPATTTADRLYIYSLISSTGMPFRD